MNSPEGNPPAREPAPAALPEGPDGAEPPGGISVWMKAGLANALMLSVAAYALATHTTEAGLFQTLARMATSWDNDTLPPAVASPLYRWSVQEDAAIEWATFWGFALAAALGALAARRQWRMRRRLPWFLAGVALFCLVVALEEISWGQRLLNFRPPTYFLEHNFQQELNFHNLVATSWRKQLLMAVMLGYGVLLPAVAYLPPVGRGFARLGIVPPPAATLPAFYVTFHLYQLYPWKFTGELVELMLAFGFLFALTEASRPPGNRPGPGRRAAWWAGRRGAAPIAGVWLLALALGLASHAALHFGHTGERTRIRLASQETETLRRDFLAMAEARGGRLTTGCGLHKRIYSYVEKYGRNTLRRGAFRNLVRQGLPEERAKYFLDPWNNAYWIRHGCRDPEDPEAGMLVLVYSFGPNNRRDSTALELRGDDVGHVIRRAGPGTSGPSGPPDSPRR